MLVHSAIITEFFVFVGRQKLKKKKKMDTRSNVKACMREEKQLVGQR